MPILRVADSPSVARAPPKLWPVQMTLFGCFPPDSSASALPRCRCGLSSSVTAANCCRKPARSHGCQPSALMYAIIAQIQSGDAAVMLHVLGRAQKVQNLRIPWTACGERIETEHCSLQFQGDTDALHLLRCTSSMESECHLCGPWLQGMSGPGSRCCAG